MQVAVAAANFTPSEADQLRRAMGSKRSDARDRGTATTAVRRHGRQRHHGRPADEIVDKIRAFAAFGFAESHAISFALLVYASSWLKLHYPAAFCAALINAQPMGFYSPQSLVADARRHGVETRKPDINISSAGATLEAGEGPSQCPVSTRRSPPYAWGCPACAPSVTTWRRRSWRAVMPTDRSSRWPTWRIGWAVDRPGRGVGDGGRLRRLRRRRVVTRCGRPARLRQCARAVRPIDR